MGRSSLSPPQVVPGRVSLVFRSTSTSFRYLCVSVVTHDPVAHPLRTQESLVSYHLSRVFRRTSFPVYSSQGSYRS